MIVGIKGENKTGKTSLALSFPKPMLFMETDIGGYDRASYRFDVSQVTRVQYMLTRDMILKRAGISKGFVVGFKELWQQICDDFDSACADPSIATIVIDSFPQLWEICHTAFRQEIEDKTGKIRERLMPQEYGTPNFRMKYGIVYAARSANKFLVLTHYMTNEYEDVFTEQGTQSKATGNRVAAGWSHIEKEADIMIETSLNVDRKTKQASNVGTVTLCGLTREAVGLSLINPSWPDYSGIIESLRDAAAWKGG